METKVIYFVHGTTSDNATGKCSGWKQVGLTELGKERAIKLGKIRKDTYFDVIFTSDLVRAIDSAKLAFPNIQHIQDERLRECNYGDLDGKDKFLATGVGVYNKIGKVDIVTCMITQIIKVIEDEEKGIGLSRAYTNVGEMFEDLNKEE